MFSGAEIMKKEHFFLTSVDIRTDKRWQRNLSENNTNPCNRMDTQPNFLIQITKNSFIYQIEWFDYLSISDKRINFSDILFSLNIFPYRAGIDFRRQILTSKVDLRTVRVKIFLIAVDPSFETNMLTSHFSFQVSVTWWHRNEVKVAEYWNWPWN